jgi:copper chaperone CopZ
MNNKWIFKWSFLLFAFACMMSNTASAQSAKTPVANEDSKATIKMIDLQVDGMSCQKGCADGIDKKLKTVSGIVKSKTTLATGLSKITYDESKVSVNTIISIINARGYKAKIAENNKKV